MPNLTIHLLRDTLKYPAEALAIHAEHHPIDDGLSHIGDLYVAAKPEHSPSWAPFFRDYVDINQLGKVRSTGAVLIVKTAKRYFALTFGQGRFILRQDMIEERFGLIATLNSLESDALRSVDKRTFDAVDQNSRVQVGQTSAAQDFGIDIERDLIKGIVGYPKETKHLGRRMAGADALTVSRDIDLSKIRPVLRSYLKAYESKAYKENFAWIDQIHQVRKKGHIADMLNELLIDRLNSARANSGTTPGCWMAVPDVLDWNTVEGFRFTQNKKDGMHTDMHLPGFFDSLNSHDPLSVELLKMRHVYAVNADHFEVQHWSVYKCLHCELDHEGRSYLLSGGQWFDIDTSFVDVVNAFYNDIPQYKYKLPIYDHDKEGHYNKALCDGDPKQWAFMDAIPIPVGGIHDKVEFCDAFGAGKEMLHVKHYGGSNLLGHLFNQGLVSGELLRDHKDYAKLVNKKLPPTHQIDDPQDMPRNVSDFKVVFAIISQSDEPTVNIPFFARVALKNVYRRLESIGFKEIMLAKISCADYYKHKIKLKYSKNKKKL